MTEGVAIYGGTFDPIHYGHIKSAIALRKKFGVSVKMVPSFVPPHRALPSSNSEQRLEMLRLAVKGVDGVEVDSREFDRAGTSYTIETIASFRKDYGKRIPIFCIIGVDAYLLLDEWREWQRLTEFANLIILERPGFEGRLPKIQVQEWAQDKLQENLSKLSHSRSGSLCRIKLPQINISATMIRNALLQNQTVDGLLPETVIEYIKLNGLYRAV
jgi:nicotinate-nucleotide adenylyltransferase